MDVVITHHPSSFVSLPWTTVGSSYLVVTLILLFSSFFCECMCKSFVKHEKMHLSRMVSSGTACLPAAIDCERTKHSCHYYPNRCLLSSQLEKAAAAFGSALKGFGNAKTTYVAKDQLTTDLTRFRFHYWP